MDLAKGLAHSLKLNYNVVQARVRNVTQSDSLRQPQPPDNCLNWILGHVVASRGVMLTLIGVEPLWDDTEYAHYHQDSQPISAAYNTLPLEKLLSDLKDSQDHLVSRVKRMSAKELDAVAADNSRTVGDRLRFLVWHETYHVGQMEYLRQPAGTAGDII